MYQTSNYYQLLPIQYEVKLIAVEQGGCWTKVSAGPEDLC